MRGFSYVKMLIVVRMCACIVVFFSSCLFVFVDVYVYVTRVYICTGE